MKRRTFVGIAGGIIIIEGAGGYLLSDKNNFIRTYSKSEVSDKSFLNQSERDILLLASLSPSGHNTQPWFIKYIEPNHWIICNDKNRWLPGVDPTQRETILSIGSFAQILEHAAANAGYNCAFTVLTTTNQYENVMDVKLTKASIVNTFDINKIKNRRTVRSNYLNDALKKEGKAYLFNEDNNFSILYHVA